MASTTHPAVYAALTTESLGIPMAPDALSFGNEALNSLAGMPGSHFLAGVVAGATLASAFSVAVRAHASRSTERCIREAYEAHALGRRFRSGRHAGEDDAVSLTDLSEPAAEKPTVSATARHRHEERSLEDVASAYVENVSFSERMAARARGVADVLSERLGGEDMFEGLPVIARADGTVGDVGTGWWDRKLGNSVRRKMLFPGEEDFELKPETSDELLYSVNDVPTGSVRETDGHLGVPQASNTGGRALNVADPGKPARHPVDSSVRSRRISEHVSEVNNGVYPERREYEDLEQGDLWEMALKAMSEKIAQQERHLVDRIDSSGEIIDDSNVSAGTAGEIGELGLSGGAASIKGLHIPEGHPEIVDAETYVDYLVRDEMSKNRSSAVRESSRDYLTLIEGGSKANTRPLRLRRRREPSRLQTARTAYAPRHAATSYSPRHLAPSMSVAEA